VIAELTHRARVWRTFPGLAMLLFTTFEVALELIAGAMVTTSSLFDLGQLRVKAR
jgi:hypothetical protein